MPPPKKVAKLEKLREKGIDVSYPDAPWFTYHKEELERDKQEKIRRIAEA